MHVRTCKLVRHLLREIKSTIELKHSYIYDFGPRQCLAMPASSDKSADALALAFIIGVMRSGWVGRSLAAAFEIQSLCVQGLL